VDTSSNRSNDQRIAAEAADWLINLEENEADLPAFAAWLLASPRHAEEFLLCSAVWHAANRLDEARRIDIDTLLAQAHANVARFDDGSIPRPRPVEVRHGVRRMLRGAFAAAAALVIATAGLLIGLHDDAARYETKVGEQRAVKLPDGSVVTLNTRSQIAVRLGSYERSVELISGEAMFDVAHDAHRPFRVLAGAAAVRAVGTQFNVRRSPHATTVTVVQGIVDVTSVAGSARGNEMQATAAANRPERLVAGEQAQLSAQGNVLAHREAEIDRVVAWRQRRLIFRNEALGVIADEFNRYNDTQIVIEGATTAARRVTAVFEADQPQALIAFLERDRELSVQSRGDRVVIRGP
jgi:transmembrane sensor